MCVVVKRVVPSVELEKWTASGLRRKPWEAVSKYPVRQCLSQDTLCLEIVGRRSVWSVVCFFIDRTARHQGVTRALLDGAVDYALHSAAHVVQGSPAEPGAHLYTYIGSPVIFLSAGFSNVTPPGRELPVMRHTARP